MSSTPSWDGHLYFFQDIYHLDRGRPKFQVPNVFFKSIMDFDPVGYWPLTDRSSFELGPDNMYDAAITGATPELDIDDHASEYGVWQNYFGEDAKWEFAPAYLAYRSLIGENHDGIALRDEVSGDPYNYAEAEIWFDDDAFESAQAGLKFRHEGGSTNDHFDEINNGFAVFITPAGWIQAITSTTVNVHNFSGGDKPPPRSRKHRRKLGLHKNGNNVDIYLDNVYISRVAFAPSTQDGYFALGSGAINTSEDEGYAYFTNIKVGWVDTSATPAYDNFNRGYYDLATPNIRQRGPFDTTGIRTDTNATPTTTTPAYTAATPHNYSSFESFTIGCVVDLDNPNLNQIQSIVDKLAGGTGQYSIEFDNRASAGRPESLRFSHGISGATPTNLEWDGAATPMVYGGLLHCVADCDSASPTMQMRIYWNGELKASATGLPSNATPNNTVLRFGGWSASTGLVGVISNVALYEYALSEEQIMIQAQAFFQGGIVL